MTERKIFEEWASKKGHCIYVDDVNRYISPTTDLMFKAWQASASREGYKLVPVRCNNKMAHAAKAVDGRLSVFKYGDVWDAMLGAVE